MRSRSVAHTCSAKKISMKEGTTTISSQFVGRATLFGVALLFSAQMHATTIAFEGIAPAGSSTTEANQTRLVDGFDVFSNHGHYFDSVSANNDPRRPNNGTDYFIADNINGITITDPSGGSFSLSQFDSTQPNSRLPRRIWHRDSQGRKLGEKRTSQYFGGRRERYSVGGTGNVR